MAPLIQGALVVLGDLEDASVQFAASSANRATSFAYSMQPRVDPSFKNRFADVYVNAVPAQWPISFGAGMLDIAEQSNDALGTAFLAEVGLADIVNLPKSAENSC